MGTEIAQPLIPCQGTNTVRRGKCSSFPSNPALPLHTMMFLVLISFGRKFTFSSPLSSPRPCSAAASPLRHFSATPPTSRQGRFPPPALRGHTRWWRHCFANHHLEGRGESPGCRWLCCEKRTRKVSVSPSFHLGRE